MTIEINSRNRATLITGKIDQFVKIIMFKKGEKWGYLKSENSSILQIYFIYTDEG